MESQLPPEPRRGPGRTRAAQRRDGDLRRRHRLLQMLEMAQTYLGCSKAQLAVSLNRDPAKVAPDSGNPKLDLVVGISELLDWSVGDVAEALWWDPVEDEVDDEPLPAKSYEELNRESIEAHRRGDHQQMRRIGEFMWRLAKTPVERAKAANRIMGAYEQGGRYHKALEWARVAANEPGVPDFAHYNYLAHVAALNFHCWHLHEAALASSQILAETAHADPEDSVMGLARGMAAYVSGNARRRLMSLLPERREVYGPTAIAHLELGREIYDRVADCRSDDRFRAVAHSCQGALIEVHFLLGSMTAQEATSTILTALSDLVDPGSHPKGDWLESWGWWAVHGLNIAIRGLEGEERERMAAIFSTKAHEIADRLENWAIRERVFSLEHDLKMSPTADGDAGRRRWVLDREDVRNLLGTMGRFPWFRRIGWQILENAEFI